MINLGVLAWHCRTNGVPMTSNRKSQIYNLLKGVETGDEESVKVVSQDTYIQHNPQTHEGSEGLASLFKRLSKTNPSVNIVRIFSDGDYVFAHTEYDFGSPRVGFEVFRFEGDQTVEHWDNIQSRKGPNLSDHTMVDGAIEISDIGKTKLNRKVVQTFIEEVIINRQFEKLDHYIDGDCYSEHNPDSGDGLSALKSFLSELTSAGEIKINYTKSHRVLAEGNFVLSVSEGFSNGVHSSFYDLFRLADGKLVEHWDTIEAVPPKTEWKNDNGKF